MHDVSTLIYVLGTLIEAAATFLAVTHTSHKEDYQYAKQHNPAFADKMKWLYDVAQYIVTQQATHTDASGAEKKQAATDALLEQAKASKAKLTKETAEGMVEKAYKEGVKNETK